MIKRLSSGMTLARFPRGTELITEPGDLRSLATDVSGRTGAEPLGIARPRSVDEVQDVMRWANTAGVPIVPISSGAGPRRRGDTICPKPAVILDLSKLDRIIHVDGRDAIAVIEAGVTFAQFDAALRPHGLRSFRPLMARPTKSVVAAFLEREPITVPGQQWDSADPLAAMEFVFGTGDLYRTGGAAAPGTLDENLARGNRQMLGVGPGHTDFGRVLQGAQGALGVVTWASIYCRREPKIEVPLFASANNLESIVALAYRLLRRRSAGQLFLMNGRQLALLCAEDEAQCRALSASLPAWLLYLEVSAFDYYPEEAIAYQRADIERDAKVLDVVLGPQVASIAAGWFASRIETMGDRPAAGLGMASEEVFCLTQLDRIEHMLGRIDQAMRNEACIYVQPLIHGVNAHLQLTLTGHAGRETALSGAALRMAESLADSGGFFSRPYHPWAHVPFERDGTIISLLAKTKALLDPHKVLQPGAQSLGGSL